MNRNDKLALVGIFFMVSGCSSKQSQVPPTAASNHPSVVLAAAPLAPGAPAAPHQLAAPVQAVTPDKPDDPAQDQCDSADKPLIARLSTPCGG